MYTSGEDCAKGLYTCGACSTTTADNRTIGRVLVVVVVTVVIVIIVITIIIVITVITVVIVLATVIIIALSRYQLELFLGTKWNSS